MILSYNSTIISPNRKLYLYSYLCIKRNAIKKVIMDNNNLNIIRFKQFEHRLYNKLPLHHNLKLKQFYN